jgi:hypothetical protein
VYDYKWEAGATIIRLGYESSGEYHGAGYLHVNIPPAGIRLTEGNEETLGRA